MLLTATGLFIEVARFVQIILWIVLPILVLSLLIAYLVHRMRIKKATGATAPDDQSFFTSMENPGHGAYVLFDHSGLIRKYRNKLSYNQARYFALKHDFDKLEAKYAAMANSSSPSIHNKKNTMKNPTESVTIENEYLTENKELAERLQQLTLSYKALEEENESLLEQINLQTASDDEKSMIVNRWREENAVLKNKAAEQDYLQDVVEEKKRQIDFLQQQLEQRIKNYHQSEQQQTALKRELDTVKNELHRKEEQLAEKNQAFSANLDQLLYLENVLGEIKQQNELLNAALADSRDVVSALQEQLSLEQSRVAAAEQKLSGNRQLLQRFYKEFTACIDADKDASPVVITMRPDYLKEEWSEPASQ